VWNGKNKLGASFSNSPLPIDKMFWPGRINFPGAKMIGQAVCVFISRQTSKAIQGTKLKKHKTANAADTAQLVNSPPNLCTLKEPSERERLFLWHGARKAHCNIHTRRTES